MTPEQEAVTERTRVVTRELGDQLAALLGPGGLGFVLLVTPIDAEGEVPIAYAGNVDHEGAQAIMQAGIELLQRRAAARKAGGS